MSADDLMRPDLKMSGAQAALSVAVVMPKGQVGQYEGLSLRLKVRQAENILQDWALGSGRAVDKAWDVDAWRRAQALAGGRHRSHRC